MLIKQLIRLGLWDYPFIRSDTRICMEKCCFQCDSSVLQEFYTVNMAQESEPWLHFCTVSVSYLQVGCEAVPHRATVYARVVESEQLWSWAQVQPMQVEECTLLPPAAMTRCAGVPSVCDIQLSQVPPSAFTNLGPLCAMFRWSSHALYISLSYSFVCVKVLDSFEP